MKKNRARNWWKPAMCGASMLLLGAALPVHADPLFVSKDGDMVVTLHSEPCALDAVTNLPGRATWLQDGKLIEGCWGLRPPVVMMYFNDKTVASAMMREFSVFEKVSGT